MHKLLLDPAVEEDLWVIWEFIARDNPPAADRVIAAVKATFLELAATPEIGVRRRFRDPRLAEVRAWRVSGFERYLIFYRVWCDEVQIHHVFHGARNIEALFGET